jgi:hypothetical protein
MLTGLRNDVEVFFAFGHSGPMARKAAGMGLFERFQAGVMSRQ